MSTRTIKTCDQCRKDFEYDDEPFDVEQVKEIFDQFVNLINDKHPEENDELYFHIGNDMHFCSLDCLMKFYNNKLTEFTNEIKELRKVSNESCTPELKNDV